MVRFSEYFQGSTNRTAIKKERKVEDNTKGFGKKKKLEQDKGDWGKIMSLFLNTLSL